VVTNANGCTQLPPLSNAPLAVELTGAAGGGDMEAALGFLHIDRHKKADNRSHRNFILSPYFSFLLEGVPPSRPPP